MMLMILVKFVIDMKLLIILIGAMLIFLIGLLASGTVAVVVAVSTVGVVTSSKKK